MENEILKQILQKLETMDSRLETMDTRLLSLEEGQSKLEAGQSKLDVGQQRIEKKLDTFQEQFNEHEVKDANRHIEILGVLSELRADITTLEDISGKNLRDIAFLKRAK